ncbi:MAG: BON domain-containing protein [Elusimicrobia bacterium]|nr:BON domain-containing protein [Elusimicrobiota bacterium]
MKTLLALLIMLSAATGCRQYWNVDMTDPAIKARVLHAFKADSSVDVSRVEVDVHAGTVTLSGIVTSDETRDKLRRLARNQRGVEQVDNNLIIIP